MQRSSTPMCLNELTETQRVRVLHYVREGMSLRSIERLTGHRRETISRYARREGLEVPSARPSGKSNARARPSSPRERTDR